MLLEEIEKEWAADTELNHLKLDSESLKIPKLHSKYYNILFKEKLVLLNIKNKLDKREYILEQYYSNNLTLDEINENNLPVIQNKKVLKTEIPKTIANDTDVVTLKTKIGAQNIKIEFLESILKSIQNRNWVIRDAIEWRKFENGS